MLLMRFKKLSVALWLVGMSSVSFAQPNLVKSQNNIEEYRLDNGLKIILAPNPKEKQIFMNTVYFTGSLNDPKTKGGMAHLLEHLAFKGTKNIPGDEFQRRLNQYTLSTNASTDYYSTKYTNLIRPDANALEQLIQLEAERMDKLVLQEKYVPAEIDIVEREREIRLDQPFSVLIDQLFKKLYGNEYLGRLPIGDLQELQSINMQELEAFYKDWYMPNNAVMVIAGKFDKAQVLKSIDQHFSGLKARQTPAQVKVPAFNMKAVVGQQLKVEKGSDFAQFQLYLTPPEEKVKAALAIAPVLYTLQPSGHLYQQVVETGKATAVQSSSWLDQNLNLMFMGAIYSPQHQADQLKKSLIETVEKKAAFNAQELGRVQGLTKNQAENIEKSSASLGARLSDYIVAYDGDWTRYFKDLEQVQNLKPAEVNQIYQDFFKSEHRLEAHILPTPEDQKQAQQQKAVEPLAPVKPDDESVKLKDERVYQQEIKRYLASSKQLSKEKEKQIIRSKLKNGAQYALYPVSTKDDKIYASIDVNFGTAESLQHQGEIIGLTAYLLTRGSTQYSLQDIMDKSIASAGSARVSSTGNGMNIQITAKKEHFNDYFNYILDVLKNPSFEQTQFDLIRSQSLASLDRPYTEPSTVSSLTLARLLERFPEGDLRHHAEPTLLKKSYEQATRQDVVDLYQKYMAMQHAFIAVTGEFEVNQMKKQLQQSFENWSNSVPYERITTPYDDETAQKIHALAEQREFGHYIAVMRFPVGMNDKDMSALQIFRHVLADSQLSSRLAQGLREKGGLVYGFSGNVNFDPWVSSGSLGVSANYSAGKSAQVSQTVHQVLKDMIEKGLTAQELAEAKSSILKKRLSALEDERRIHSMLNGHLERNETLLTRVQRDQHISRLSLKEVNAAIKKHIRLEHLVEVMADQYGVAQPEYKATTQP